MNLIRQFFLIGLLFSGFLHGQAPYEMLWEVRHPAQERPSYLFGTMHISDRRVYDLPDSVLLAMNQVDRVAFETDLDSFCVKFFDFVLGDGLHSINDLQELEGRLKSGMGKRPDIGELLRDPEKLRKALEEREQSREEAEAHDGNPLQFLDATLFRVAKQIGKETVALETLDSQLELLLGLNGDALMASSISEKDLRRLYLSGNVREIGRLLDNGELMGPETKEALIDKRNRLMAVRSDSLMRISPAFVAVGAAHLPGKQGILELLKDKGYSVRPVLAQSNTGMMKGEVAKPYQPRWIDWEDPGNGIRMRLPAKPYRLNFSDVEFPMFAGLDFQGGFMYYFMAVPLGEMMNKTQKEQFARTFYQNFNGVAGGEEAKRIQVNGMEGLAFGELDGKEYMRGQVLVGEEMAFVLFAGIDADAMNSPAMNEIFASVKEIPVIGMADGPWKNFKDNRLGIKGLVPHAHVFSYEPHEAAPDLKSAGTWTYRGSDARNNQEFWISVTSLPPYYYYDSIETTFNTIMTSFESGEFSVESQEKWDGLGSPALKTKLRTTEGMPFYLNLLQRGNRLYMVGTSFAEDDPRQGVLVAKLDSISLLPLQASRLTERLTHPAFEAWFPDQPTQSDYSENDHWYTLVFDSLQSWEARDPGTGHAFFLSRIELGPFFRIPSAEALADSILYREAKNAWVVKRNVAWDGFDLAWEAVARNIDPNQFDHFRLGIKGGVMYCLKVQTEDSLVGGEAFFKQFKMVERPEPFDLSARKLQKLIQQCQSTDTLQRARAWNALEFYDMGQGEWKEGLDHLMAVDLSKEPDEYVFTLIDKVVFSSDSVPLTVFNSLYKAFEANLDLQVFLLSGLIQAEGMDTRKLAVDLLRENAPRNMSAAQLQDLAYGISGYFALEKEQISAFDSLTFLAEVQELEPLFWQACWELAQWGDLEARHLGLYRETMQRIATDWILHPRYELGNPGQLSFDYELAVWVLAAAEPDEKSYSLVRSVMEMGDPALEEYAALTLLERDYDFSSKVLRRILDRPGNRYYLTNWMLEHQRTRLVPKKYFKEERLSVVDLEGYFMETGQEVLQLELQDVRTIQYEGQMQRLYVYKVGLKGEKDWITGFSGPFPVKGGLEYLGLPLTGTEMKKFPSSQLQLSSQVIDWIEANEAWGEE